MALTLESRPSKIGAIIPSKDISIAKQEDGGDSDLAELIKAFPDKLPGFFIGAYHHTLLEKKLGEHPKSATGETQYSNNTPFPDLISMLSLIIAHTKFCKIYTAVAVLPQIPTAAAAQMFAAIAENSRGRFSLGVGAGWNEREINALRGAGFYNSRGMVLDQQLPIIKRLMAGKSVDEVIVDKHGRIIEDLRGRLAINPFSKYPIPTLVGGGLRKSVAPLRRAAKHDGWIPLGNVELFREKLPILLQFLEDGGRSSDGFELMGRITLGVTPPDQWIDKYLEWIEAGATHIALTTTNAEKPNADWGFHLQLFWDFWKKTKWIRELEKGKFSELFSKHGGAGSIAKDHGLSSKYELSCIELIHKEEHLKIYLSAKGFSHTNLDYSKKIKIKESRFKDETIEYTVTDQWQNQITGEMVWLLKSEWAQDKPVVIFDENMDKHRVSKREI